MSLCRRDVILAMEGKEPRGIWGGRKRRAREGGALQGAADTVWLPDCKVILRSFVG